jgi:hypothetical protein
MPKRPPSWALLTSRNARGGDGQSLQVRVR